MSNNPFRFDSSRSMAAVGMSAEPTRSELEFEARWHYSTTLHAELLGEAVLHNILLCAPNSKRVTTLLNSQLHDEVQHSKLYRRATEITGFESASAGYGQSYSVLVTAEKSFCRKVFIFQVLTETIAQTFAEWRLSAIQHEELARIDRIVLSDEIRHLGFAEPLLFRCDPEQVREELDPLTLRRLTESMIMACKNSMDRDFYINLGRPGPSTNGRRKHELDLAMPRRILSATKRISNFVENRTRTIA